MNKPTIFAVLLLIALPLTASASGKRSSAQMEVSFTVVESCTVRMGSDEPDVKCQFDTPYLKQLPARASGAAAAAAKKVPTSSEEITGEQPAVIYF